MAPYLQVDVHGGPVCCGRQVEVFFSHKANQEGCAGPLPQLVVAVNLLAHLHQAAACTVYGNDDLHQWGAQQVRTVSVALASKRALRQTAAAQGCLLAVAHHRVTAATQA